MGFHPYNGGKALVKFALTQLGKGYSEQSPVGSSGDGHWWNGGPLPTKYDCSGFTYVCCRKVGIQLSNGNAEDQWLRHLGGVVPPTIPLRPGDIGSFMGAENTPGYAGHTGIVVSYDKKTQTGVLVNAYDTEKGVCLIPFNRRQRSNLSNGLGVIGFYRPANSLPRLLKRK